MRKQIAGASVLANRGKAHGDTGGKAAAASVTLWIEWHCCQLGGKHLYDSEGSENEYQQKDITWNILTEGQERQKIVTAVEFIERISKLFHVQLLLIFFH